MDSSSGDKGASEESRARRDAASDQIAERRVGRYVMANDGRLEEFARPDQPGPLLLIERFQ